MRERAAARDPPPPPPKRRLNAPMNVSSRVVQLEGMRSRSKQHCNLLTSKNHSYGSVKLTDLVTRHLVLPFVFVSLRSGRMELTQ